MSELLKEDVQIMGMALKEGDHTPKIYQCMVEILKDVGRVGIAKSSYNPGLKYQFRGIDDVYNTLNKLLAKHQVVMQCRSMESRLEERGSKTVVVIQAKYAFIATDGSFVETYSQGEGMAIDDKASSKAMSGAHKYAILQAFCIPTEELEDCDNYHYEGNKIITDPKKIHNKQEDAPVVPISILEAITKAVMELDTPTLQKGYNMKYKNILDDETFPDDIRTKCLNLFVEAGVYL